MGCTLRMPASAMIVLVVLQLMAFVVRRADAQILHQFPNLFRGGRRPESSSGTNNNGDRLLAIQPIVVSSGSSSNSSQNAFPYEREGLIRLNPNVWHEAEIEVELFDASSRYKFRQSPTDQPTPNMFYGILTSEDGTESAGTDTDVAYDQDNNESEIIPDSSIISLVQTTVTTSNIPVVAGSIHVDGTLYQIRQLPSGDLVLDQRGPFDEFDPEVEIEEDDPDKSEWEVSPLDEGKIVLSALEVDVPPNRRNLRIGSHNASSSRALQSGDDGSQLDILIIYSRNAMCAAAGFPNSECQPSPENKVTIEGIIKLAVEETNEAFAKSGIPTKLRAVKVHYEDKYDDTAEAWPTVFSHYTGDNDGNMDYIHAMRDQYGADFVSFIVNTRGYCGSAHRPTEPNAARVFSMVRWDCATGHYTFTHELAHTFGCRHDRESTRSAYQAADFNFGYQYYKPALKQASRFRTLMAYNCPDGGCQRILQFSTPSKARNGIQFGNVQADNARFIRERLEIYANFRQSVPFSPPAEPQLSPPRQQGPVTASVYPKNTDRLDTVSHPGSLIGAAGNMFEVVAKTDVKVTGFAVTPYAATTCIVAVYKLNDLGNFVGKELDPAAWTLLGRAEIETKENDFNTLPSGTIDHVIVKEGTTQSFYVTFQDDTNYNRYSRAAKFGEVASENSDIQFKVGYTANYPFRFHPKAPRMFNGEILYEKMTDDFDIPAAASTAESGSNANGLGSDLKSFQTTFESNNGYAGNLFTIKAKNDMVVERFDLNVGSTEKGLKVIIYTKFGDYGRSDVDPSQNWRIICSTTVDGQGESNPTHVPAEAIKSVAIKANEKQSFYVTFTDTYMKYTSGANLDPDYLSNDDVSLVASAGTQYPFQSYFDNRIWNGNLIYYLGDGTRADIQGRQTKVMNPSGPQSDTGAQGNNVYAYGVVSSRQQQP